MASRDTAAAPTPAAPTGPRHSPRETATPPDRSAPPGPGWLSGVSHSVRHTPESQPATGTAAGPRVAAVSRETITGRGS
ncbi:hypothetical protein Apa02nite_062980 [Actinoplanes palleronii]|uniref:Uncharacterized protein n=1 Tax=Actinoplanes palleronii TaxID=113570 RepID=A0ABQ4BHN1_9ACTN|nr:hypothetical protein Apa02nite_062980 [Actinoplanes palleronii]